MTSEPEKRYLLYKLLLFLPVVLLLAGAILFPFYFETTTLWYKFGADKTYLRVGQIAGTLAFCLILLQIILAVGGKLLERVYGKAGLLRCHRYNGVVILLFAITHVLLILIPEGLDNLPIGKRHWPEMIGGAAFFLLLLTVLTSFFNAVRRLNYKLWQRFHRTAGFFIVLAVGLHLFFVSDSFEQSVPQIILAALLIIVTCWVVAVKWIFKRK